MYRTVWTLLHAVYHLIATIASFVFALEQYATGLFCSKAASDENDQLLIELSKPGLIKVPKHIVIIFNDANQPLESLARLIRWIVLTGVRHVSFYDFRGKD